MSAANGWEVIKVNKQSAFSVFHPAVLFIYLLSVLIISMFSTNPVILALAIGGGMLFCGVLQGGRLFASSLVFYIPFFVMVAVTNPLFSHNGVTPLFFMNGNPVTIEAIFYGIDIAAMIVGVAYWCRCYTEVMTQDKFFYLFSKAAPKLSLILSMALRFIPIFKAQAKNISQAQKAMGLYSSKSIVDKLHSAVRIFSSLVTWSLENSVDTARSMKARGYGTAKRSSFSLFKFTAPDAVMLFVSFIITGMTLLGIGVGALSFTFYPEISSIRFTPVAVISYISFGLLSFLPSAMEISEEIRWKYYISKI